MDSNEFQIHLESKCVFNGGCKVYNLGPNMTLQPYISGGQMVIQLTCAGTTVLRSDRKEVITDSCFGERGMLSALISNDQEATYRLTLQEYLVDLYKY